MGVYATRVVEVAVAAIAGRRRSRLRRVDRSARPAERRHAVRRGESLWSIAEEHLGSAARYTEILDLNSELLGMRPGFLTPGLVLTLPPVEPWTPAADSRITVPTGPKADHVHTVRAGETLASIAAEQLGSSSRYPEILEASTDIIQSSGHRLADADGIQPGWKVAIPRAELGRPVSTYGGRVRVTTPSWLNPGLDRGGTLVAGALFLHWQARRRDQRESRRPGRTIALPPPALWRTEQSLRLLGGAHSDTLRWLDLALRSLGATCRSYGRSLPDVVAVRLGAFGMVLHLSELTEPPPGWESGGSGRWLLRRCEPLADEHTALPAPYPFLVTLGCTAAGDVWLVNADTSTGLTVAGDGERCADFARHVTLELASNPWSHGVRVQSNGVQSGLTSTNGDSDRPRASGRSATVRVDLVGSTARVKPDNREATRSPGQPKVELTTGGVATIVGGAVSVAAVGMSSAEAASCVEVLAHGRDGQDIAMPPMPLTGLRWREVVDHAGAALPRYARARDPMGEDERQGGSLLPLPDSRYLEVAATTRADLQRVAPRITQADRAMLSTADPALDADLEAWFDPATPAPRLSLLGPVQIHTTGEPLHRRHDYYAELVTYLVLAERGRSANDVAEAFALDHIRVRNDLVVLRGWLGEDPWRGRSYLGWSRPRGAQQFADAVGRYRVEDALTDIDLLLRLRLRAQSRESSGIDDLVIALSLVRGPPFTDLPAGAWSWFAAEDRVDEHITAAVVDVAHVVTTHALGTGDLALAGRANKIARMAAPDDGITRWDQVAVETARGDPARVERVRSAIPPEPTDRSGAAGSRTQEIRARHQW